MNLGRLAFAATAGAIITAGFFVADLARAAETLPVPAATIYPGDTISAEMLADGTFPDGTSSGFPVATTRGDLIGKVARRTLLPGKLIARNTIADPELVQKGKIVSAVYQQGPLIITASVLALQSGSLDDAIQVRNVDSGKVIVGTVTADGGVRIGPK
jgi:flagella basal body P-ring formation protein FlgA